ncbi:DUF2730 family protein [Chelatococcus sp. XZ-Ab1]|uniref:DUF2730 family protein n=1 Tax=Chelatococcus sp. XZ-Ab1 TaxID=3034027 RepID=UPI0023E41CD8|nr:DUF2730 family protein [Chelatococcus sp. XZ-Ab1]
MSELMTFIQAYGGALALLGSIAVILLSSKFVTRDQLAASNKRIDDIEDRLITLEGEMRHLPDKDVSHRMELAIKEMQGDISVLAERLKPVAEISRRLQELFLEQAKGRS